MKSDAINISLELELRRDRIGSWRAEADTISTGCIPVVFIKEIVAPRRKCHRLPSEMGIPRNPQIHQRLSACIAMDAGLSRPIRLFISDTIPPIIQWTGLHADRVSTLTQEMAAGNSPSCLITHALYKRLSPSIQAKYATLYYIHIISIISAAIAQSYNKINTSKNARRL